MADWVRTYIDKIDTLLKADLDTEIAAIDANLGLIPDNQIFKSRQSFTQKHPLVHQYPMGQSSFENLINHNTEIRWQHYTGVRVKSKSVPESDGNLVYAYVEAVLKAIYKGNGASGKLDSIACYSEPLEWVNGSPEFDDDGFYIVEGGIVWAITIAYNLVE